MSRRNRLRHFVGDGVWASICEGAAETNFHSFASTLTPFPQYISYLSSSQNFAGCWFQLWSDRLVKLAGGPKPLVLTGVSLQAVTLFLMVFMALSNAGLLPFMIAMFIFTALGGLAGPVWNSWIASLLPRRRRGFCYGVRNQRTYPAQFLALLVGGGLLQFLTPTATGIKGMQIAFCAVFFLGFAAKLLSLRHLILQPNVPYNPPARALGPMALLKYSAKNPEIRKAAIFFSAMGFAVTISGPYQTPFMLKNLHMGYFPFAAAAAALVLARFASAAPVGKLVDRIGYEKPLLASSFLMPLIPLGWTLSTNFIWILMLQVFGGVIWTVFDLAVFNYLSENASPEHRQRLFSIRHISWNLAAAAGALLGGLLISRYDMPMLVFWSSTFARLGAALFVLPALGLISIDMLGRPLARLRAGLRL
ncbi:MAG: hypothetical protein A2X94_06640 [Bdellovibrionales bacterium GWB1_55_8]|nr:MAG: hypothetical protein A2X94_06640 [Bdellovibrionales bacterium GWB1_55_8]